MPDTMDYMVTGYVIGLGLLALMILSLWWRSRSLKADEAALEKLEAEEKSSVKTAPSEKADVAKAL